MRLIPACLLFLYALTAAAVPAKRTRCTLTLADGTTVEATWTGDERLHYYAMDDGRCLECDDDGIAHFIDPDTLQKRREAKVRRRQAAWLRRNAPGRKAPRRAITGSKPGLVILVQFPDVPFHYNAATFQRFFNEIGYKEGVNAGSVRDYFLDASYGQFDFTFDIIGPVTMKDSLYHYGGNNSNGDDQHPAVMVAEAIAKIDEAVDFTRYDWDGDGVVEQVFVVHSGHDESQSRVKNDIWSHAWTLTEAIEEGDGDGPVTADGVVVDSYATSSELRGWTGTAIAGIGTACHEFSHCFGLPDFYDTEGYCFGMNSWDLMDYGEYNGNGGTPAGFTSYERMFCGWLNPVELTEACEVRDMPALTSEPTAYIIRNSGKADEYYLLENRQQEAWDTYLGGHGLLVLHVDYDSEAWKYNTVNTKYSHQRMTIIPADNLLFRTNLSGDPWPGTSGKTELSDTSTPAATLFNVNAEGDKLMHHSLTGITESPSGLIGFTFDEEALGLSAPSPLSQNEEAVCDLQGRKWQAADGLRRMPPGIYIQSGKKILIR